MAYHELAKQKLGVIITSGIQSIYR